MKKIIFFIFTITLSFSIGLGSCASSDKPIKETQQEREQREARNNEHIRQLEEQRRLDEQKQAEAKAAEAEKINQRKEAERSAYEALQKPIRSPEGQEYVLRTLAQAVDTANLPANRGKTLFFQSEARQITRYTEATGYVIVNPSKFTNDLQVLMQNNNRLVQTKVPAVGLEGVMTQTGYIDAYVICYRVTIDRSGTPFFKIDLFRQ